AKQPARPTARPPARPARREPDDAPAAASKAPLFIVLGVTTVVALGTLYFLFGRDDKPVAVAPVAAAPPPVVAPKPPSQPAKPPSSIIKDLPDDIRKELAGAAGKISDKVNPLEHRMMPLEKQMGAGDVPDPEATLKEIESLQEAYAVIADELDELITAKKYEPYFKDPAYGVAVKQFNDRTAFYSQRLSTLKKWKGAVMPMAQKAAAGKPAASDPPADPPASKPK
ncbi:MAG TPA: hypothetical protein VKE69_05775, partial [Planctomycetota bacterium]|nr:hypothetical protein [Planctomycetota bacterium]